MFGYFHVFFYTTLLGKGACNRLLDKYDTRLKFIINVSISENQVHTPDIFNTRAEIEAHRLFPHPMTVRREGGYFC